MKNYHVIWSEQAKDDLRAIYNFIFDQSKQGADIVFDTLLNLGDSLSTTPRRFPIEILLTDSTYEFRFLPKWSYKIIYLIIEEQDPAVIARIFNTKQDPSRIVKIALIASTAKNKHPTTDQIYTRFP